MHGLGVFVTAEGQIIEGLFSEDNYVGPSVQMCS